MPYKLLAIAGSPVKDGNLETFLEHILTIAVKKGLTTDAVYLSQLKVKDCTHCNFCISKQIPGKYCSQNDDAQQIFEKMEQADIILLASPVYFMRTSGRMAAFIDRLRVFLFGNLVKGKLKNKIGVSAAVAWIRHGGFETTHLSHIGVFLGFEMIPVSVHYGVCMLGASAVASPGGSGEFDKNTRLGVLNDKPGLDSAEFFIHRARELAKLTRKKKSGQ